MSAYAIYARKSTEEDDRQILSIPAQVAELRELAKIKNLPVVCVYEESQSARQPGRPVFAEMMQEIDRKKISGILCWKPDRLARNMIDGGRVIDALDRQVLHEIVTPSRTTRNSSDDKFFLNLEFSMSKKVVDDLSDNVRRGNRAVLSSGRVTGMVPTGYLKDLPLDRSHGRGAGKTVIDPDRFPLVQELFRRYLSGAYSVPQLHLFARDTLGLRTRGSRRHPPGPLNVGSLYSILRNPFYAGFIKHGGELYRGDHEPVVTKAEFDRIRSQLGRHDAPRPERHAFTFVGLMHCGACGRGVTGEEHWNRHGTRYVYYRCTRRRVGDVVCREPFIAEPQVEAQFVEVLARLAIPERLLSFTWDRLEAKVIKRSESSAAVVEGFRKELVATEAELDRLTRLCTRGHLSEDEYVRSRMGLLEEVSRLRQRIENPSKAEDEVDEVLREVLSLAAQAPKAFAEGTREERREILGKICESIKLTGRNLSIELRRPYLVLAEGLPTVLSQLKESNPPETSKIIRGNIKVPRRRASRLADGVPPKKHRGSKPRIAAQYNEETAELEPAISSWCALIEKLREELRQSRAYRSRHELISDQALGIV